MGEKINFEVYKFTRVTKAVLDDETYLDKPSQKLVYAILCMYANNDTKKCQPSIKTIAKKSCCSENHVRQSLNKLKDVGLISIRKRMGRTRNYSNEYLICDLPKGFHEGS